LGISFFIIIVILKFLDAGFLFDLAETIMELSA